MGPLKSSSASLIGRTSAFPIGSGLRPSIGDCQSRFRVTPLYFGCRPEASALTESCRSQWPAASGWVSPILLKNSPAAPIRKLSGYVSAIPYR